MAKASINLKFREETLYNELRAYSDKTGASMTAVIKIALEDFLSSKKEGGQAPR